MNTLKGFLKNTVIYGIASILPRAITILLTKLKTSVFVSSDYAKDTSFYVYAAYFNVLFTYGMETAFFRFFTKEKDKNAIISTSFISIFTTTLLFLSVTLFFNAELSSFFNFKDPLFLKMLLIILVLDTLVVIPFAYLRATNKPIQFAFYKISNVLIYAILNVLFLWLVPKMKLQLPSFLLNYFGEAPKVIYIFFSQVVASFFTFIIMLPIILKFKLTFDKQILKKMLLYGLPIMIAGIAYITNENLDKLLIERFKGEKVMGIYSACYKLGVFMTLFITAFKLGAEPFFFSHSENKNAKKNYATILTWFTIFGSLILFVIVAYIKIFAKILLGRPEYFEALKIVPIILLANLFLGIYHNLSIWYKLTDKTKFGMYFSIFGAVITVVLSLIFIPIYGYMASAWITLIAYSSMTFISYYYSKKYYKITYNIPKICFYLGLSVALSLVSFYNFQEKHLISTFMLILFLGIIYRKEIFPLLEARKK